jgi:hypothetical protein
MCYNVGYEHGLEDECRDRCLEESEEFQELMKESLNNMSNTIPESVSYNTGTTDETGYQEPIVCSCADPDCIQNGCHRLKKQYHQYPYNPHYNPEPIYGPGSFPSWPWPPQTVPHTVPDLDWKEILDKLQSRENIKYALYYFDKENECWATVEEFGLYNTYEEAESAAKKHLSDWNDGPDEIQILSTHSFVSMKREFNTRKI